MNEAWYKFLRGLGNAQETEQPEYTWGRVVKHEHKDDKDIDRSATGNSAIQEGETASWTYEVLDVVGTNVDCYDQLAHQAIAKRCDDVPHPEASDHWPVSLEWRPLARRQPQKKRARNANALVKRPIPLWLLEDDIFLEQVDVWVEQWGKDRSSGFRASLEYTGTIHSMAQDYILNNVIRARTPEHKLEVALAMRSTLAQDPLNEARISRLCE